MGYKWHTWENKKCVLRFGRKDSIKIYMLQTEYEITEQIHVTQDGVKWQKFVNTVTDLRVLFKKKKAFQGQLRKYRL